MGILDCEITTSIEESIGCCCVNVHTIKGQLDILEVRSGEHRIISLAINVTRLVKDQVKAGGTL